MPGSMHMGRRDFLKHATVLGGSLMAGLWEFSGSVEGAPAQTHKIPENLFKIDHFIVATQENRSFDQYFGYYPGVDGIPQDACMPNPDGPCVKPYHFPSPIEGNIDQPNHSWEAIHAEWDNGRMDGFVKVNGSLTMGYYLESDLPYYWKLAQESVLCDHYFCSVLGPTLPNRLYLVSGTSDGLQNDPASLNTAFSQATLFDQLLAQGITWRYYVSDYSSLAPTIAKELLMCPLLWFPRIMNDSAMSQNIVPMSHFYTDLAAGNLPQVAFIAPGALDCEHPPDDVQVGMRYVQSMVNALQTSDYWPKSAFILNYDEAGGFYDHVAPRQVDSFGLGMRVPCLVASPWVQPGKINHTTFDHTSVLKMIQQRFGLAPLTSRNRIMNSLAQVFDS